MKALILNIYSLLLLFVLYAPVLARNPGHNVGRRAHRRADDPVGNPEDPEETPTKPTITLIPATSVDPPAETPSSSSSSPSSSASSASSSPVSSSVSQSESVSSSSVSQSESQSSELPSSSESATSSASASESEITSEPSSTGGKATDPPLSSILSSILSGILDPPPDSTSEAPSSQITPPPESSSDGGITLIPSSIEVSVPSSSIVITVIPSSTEDPPPSSSTSDPPSSSDPPAESSDPPVPPSSSSEPPISSSSAPPDSSISFPDGPSSSASEPSSVSSSTTAVISIPSDLSFILTESSLAIATPTETPSLTLSDPDQATTTLLSTNTAAPTEVPVFVLPEGLPKRIYPNDSGAQKNVDGSKTLISILFDDALRWPFVVNNTLSASQIFGLMPFLISSATGVKQSDVESWALQVYIPADYTGPEQKNRLGTTYLAFIDPTTVDALAAAIKVQSSAFYTVQDEVARQLASHVVSSFNVQSVPQPGSGDDAPNSSGSNTGASSKDGKQRQDAIIGVVSAFGAVAVLVLVFLVFRSIQRKRELAHRRLSDPPDEYIVGARPAGRDFDQDSVGGQRRRSFYFAEDSLRNAPQSQQQHYYDYTEVARNSPSPGGGNGMRERRIVPNVISAPVLQESSMNW